MRTVALADGTKIVLAGGASLVRTRRHERLVELTHGAIFADVAHDKDRPFRVDTGGTRIVDIGTSFEVVSKPSLVRSRSRPAPFDLVAVNGSAGRSISGRTRLRPRSTGLNRIGRKLLSVAPWRNEWAEYKGAPRSARSSRICKACRPLPIRIADAQLANRRVSGRIKLTDPVGQLENLAIVQAFRIERTEDGFLLSKN